MLLPPATVTKGHEPVTRVTGIRLVAAAAAVAGALRLPEGQALGQQEGARERALAAQNLGRALYAKKDLDGAIAEFRKAIELDPTLAPAYSGLGVALRDKKDLDGAIAQFRKAIEVDPKYAPAY